MTDVQDAQEAHEAEEATDATEAVEAAEARNAAPEWHDYPVEGEGHTVAGTLRRLEALHSPQLGNEREIVVYLPPSYGRGERRYPVVYMHDGQNLFDRATSFGAEWEVDETMEAAAHDGLEAIVVGIPNLGPERLNEYSPWRDRRHKQGGRGEAYADWIADTLKPTVDRDFRTLTGRDSTGIAGSSMGGLISLYAYFRRPETFGFAGVMSPALWFAGGAVFPYVKQRPFVPGRIYLDIGTSEGSEALGDARRMKSLLEQKGYRVGRDLMFRVEMGGGHNERAWARRLRPAMHFMLGIPARGGSPAPHRYSIL